jgi:hypothetical protein
MDERTALYLTTLYLSLDELLGGLEEEKDSEDKVLRRIAEELGKIVDILTQSYHTGKHPYFVPGSRTSTPTFHAVISTAEESVRYTT